MSSPNLLSSTVTSYSTSLVLSMKSNLFLTECNYWSWEPAKLQNCSHKGYYDYCYAPVSWDYLFPKNKWTYFGLVPSVILWCWTSATACTHRERAQFKNLQDVFRKHKFESHVMSLMGKLLSLFAFTISISLEQWGHSLNWSVVTRTWENNLLWPI